MFGKKKEEIKKCVTVIYKYYTIYVLQQKQKEGE